MKTKDAVQRIYWRFSKGESFKPNKLDLESVNEIINYFNRTEKQQYEANELFAKMYITMYKKMLTHYNATVLDKIPRMRVHQILDKNINEIIEDFTDALNNSEFYTLMKDAKCEIKHPATKLSEEKEKEVQSIKEKIKEPENYLKLVGGVWDIETVSQMLEAEVNNAINIYSR